MPESVGDPQQQGAVASNGVGRSAHFNSGFQAVREPQNRPITTLGFHPTSVLHQMLPSGIGFSNRDRQRFLYGGGLFPSLPTQLGSSQDSYQKSVWLSRGLHVPRTDLGSDEFNG